MDQGARLKIRAQTTYARLPRISVKSASFRPQCIGNGNAAGRLFNTAGPDIIESRQYYAIIADILGVELSVEEVPVAAYRREHPDKAPFLCHRIYDLAPLRDAGLQAPSTPIQEGLRLHVEGLLQRKARG